VEVVNVPRRLSGRLSRDGNQARSGADRAETLLAPEKARRGGDGGAWHGGLALGPRSLLGLLRRLARRIREQAANEDRERLIARSFADARVDAGVASPQRQDLGPGRPTKAVMAVAGASAAGRPIA
jgi:hypothetical protein